VISYEEALALTIASAKRTRPETLSLTECIGRVSPAHLMCPFGWGWCRPVEVSRAVYAMLCTTDRPEVGLPGRGCS
jgi:hypothetical protein